MSFYDAFYRHVIFPRRISSVAPQLPALIRCNKHELESSSRDEIAFRRLKTLLINADQSSEFWRKRFTNSGLCPNKLQSFDDLRALPLLEKAEVRTHLEDMASNRVPKGERHPDMTGGSTAAPLLFYRDAGCIRQRVANQWVFFSWYGREPCDRSGLIWGAQRDLGDVASFKAKARSRLLDRMIVLPGNHLNSQLIDAFLAEWRTFKPMFIHGYSQAVFFVARYVLEHRIQLPPIDAATVTAEPISHEQKKTISEAFGCPTYVIYGTREFGFLAAEAPGHIGLHVNPLNAYVEILNPDGTPTELGRPGQVVVTDLLNHATPLVRYRIGDVGMRMNDNTSYFSLPRLELAAGRETDFILTPDNRFIAGAGLTLISASGVAKLQYIQDSRSRVTVRFVRSEQFNEHSLGEIRRQLMEAIGPHLEYDFSEVDDIPLLPSGKVQYVHSEISRKALAMSAN